MTRVLLVDTNRAAYPVYQALCRLGHEVSVVGAKPTETLAKLSAYYIQLDYSDTDAIAALIAEQRFEHLVPGCTDLSYRVCASVSGGRFSGLDSPDTTRRIQDKAAFRKVATALGLSVPRTLTEAQAGSVPGIIVKPTDAFSGRGIQVLQQPSPIEVAGAVATARAASSTGDAVIEEFVTGQLHSHSAFLCQGRIVADFFVREDCSVSPFAVDTSCLAQALSDDVRQEVRAQILRFAAELELVDGLIHTQFIEHGGNFWLIEATRRCPGDIYALLIEFATGYPYGASYAAPFVGTAAKPLMETPTPERIIRHTVTARDGAELWGLRFSRPVHIRLCVPLATAGDNLPPAPAGRAAILFFQAETEADQERLYEDLLAGTLYSFDS